VAGVAVRVLIADDEVLLSAGIARLLEDAGMDVVAQVPTADRILEAVASHGPDVAIVDVQMPPERTDDGLRAAISIRSQYPGIAVLVLSNFLEERYPLDLIGDDAEGVGYLLKTRVGDVGSFVESVRRVAEGGSALDPQVVGRMVQRRRRANPIDDLTPREREVLALMAEGLGNTAIGQKLVISEGAVHKHVGNVFLKLDLPPTDSGHRRVLAVLAHLGL
jgi:DNA-binding NarL/FixJ family response regulator